MNGKMPRRKFIESTISGLSLIAAHNSTAAEPNMQKTAQRNWRILCHDDGVVVKHMQSPMDEDKDLMLAQRLKRLVDAKVCTYFYCGHDNFAQAFYKSKDSRIEVSGTNTLKLLLESGSFDPSTEHIRFCREHNIQVFWSFNMNDIQDHPFSKDPSLEERLKSLSNFKRSNSNWLLGSPYKDYPFQSVQQSIWSAFNYEQKEIREFVFTCIKEVVELYANDDGVDGLHFNYGRNASLFPPTFDQRPVEPAHLDCLTAFQKRLRDLANSTVTPNKKKRQRPLLLAATVPETLSLCRYVGIDLQTWLSKGLIDLVIAGNGYVPFTDHVREIIDLGHNQKKSVPVPVYPCLNCAADEYLFHASAPALRGVASNFSHLKGDGIFLFNYFEITDAKTPNPADPNKPLPTPNVPDTILNEIGDPQQIKGDMLFRVDTNREAWPNSGDVSYYTPLDGTVPLSLYRSGGTARFYIGDLFSSNSNPSNNPQYTYTLYVRIDNWDKDLPPHLVLNGLALMDGVPDPSIGAKYMALENGEYATENVRWFKFSDLINQNKPHIQIGMNTLEDCQDRFVTNSEAKNMKDVRLARVYLEVNRNAANK